MSEKTRVAILISGRGSNMMSLVEAMSRPGFPAVPAMVLSNRADAAGLDWSRKRQIASEVVDHKAYASREAFEAAVQERLEAQKVQLVCLAGFMRLMTAGFVERWRDRMINIHPSLLPAYKGLDTHARALADGVRIVGCTVHFVRTEMDCGPIIAQAAVPVAAGDTPDSLGARVLAAEHRLYPAALAAVAAGRVRVAGERTEFIDGFRIENPMFVPPVASDG